MPGVCVGRGSVLRAFALGVWIIIVLLAVVGVTSFIPTLHQFLAIFAEKDGE